MLHRPRGITALAIAAMLTAAMPAVGIQAAEGVAATTPLNTNLLRNAGFNATPTSTSPVPGWSVSGKVQAETFGTRAFPYPAYGRKYHGGARYLSCWGGRGGAVTQSVAVEGRDPRTYKLRARLSVSLGGVKGHRVRVSLRAIDDDAVTSDSPTYTPPSSASKTRVLEITNHYKLTTVALSLAKGTDRVVGRIQLLPKSGSTACKIMVDTATLFLFRE